MTAPFPGFYRLLDQHRYNYPLQEAVIYGDHRLSFQSLYERTNRLSNALADIGVGEGDRVLWLGQNSNAMVELLFACSRLGAAVCYANWRQSEAELAFVLEDFAPKVVFTLAEDVGGLLTNVRSLVPAVTNNWIAVEDSAEGGYEQLLQRYSAEGTENPCEPDTDRALLVLYTAAFEGRPNGAQISEPGLFLQSLLHINVFEASNETRTLISSPNFHIVIWLDMLPTFIAGGRLCIAKKTDAADILQLISREKLTNGTVQPPTAKAVAELNEQAALDISSFRSPLQLPGWTEMTSPGPGISGCGQTEVVGPVIVGAYAGDGSTPFCGRAAPMIQARIVDDAGVVVEAGAVGELIIRGPVAGLGYWNRPELNAERTSPGGWWHTRDLARRDNDGTISFVGPIAQMVKSGGENVYASEVENALQSHAAVARAGIIGTPDEDWGQVVTAVVVLKEGGSASVEQLQEHVRDQIARYKTPRIIHFTKELPLNGFTINYKALDKQFGGGGYPGEQQKNSSTIGATIKRK
jgi:long-chain acyl-CoA synthetase